MLLDKKALLSKEKLEIAKVDLGNEDFVFVRQMTGRERDSFERSLIKEKKDDNGKIIDYERSIEDFRAKLAVNTVCDETGRALLEPKDYPILSQHMSARRLELIVNKAQELNKISDTDKENLVKNSNPDPQDNSSSNSVEN